MSIDIDEDVYFKLACRSCGKERAASRKLRDYLLGLIESGATWVGLGAELVVVDVCEKCHCRIFRIVAHGDGTDEGADDEEQM